MISEANKSYIFDFIDMTLTADAMEPPTPTRSQTLDSDFSVETSNRFEGIDGFADGITKTVDETAAFACDKLHCTGEHFYGKGAKKAYARHIETKHEGPLNETETHAGLWQCATCGKVTYTTERSAKSHQTDCATGSGSVGNTGTIRPRKAPNPALRASAAPAVRGGAAEMR